MTPRVDEAVAKFTKAVEETPGLWQSLDARGVALRVGGDWHNLITRVVLDARAQSDVPRIEDLPDTSLVWAWQEVLAVEDLARVIWSVHGGQLSIAGRDLLYRQPAPQQRERMEFLEHGYDDSYVSIASTIPPASRLNDREVVGHILTCRPSGARGLNRAFDGGFPALDRHLYSLEHPWNGLGGLVRVAARSSVDPTRDEGQVAEFVAPFGVAFERGSVQLSRGRVRASVVADSKPVAKKATIGYVAEYADGAYLTDTLRLTNLWRGRRERRAEVTLALGSDVRRVTLLLRLGPHLVATAQTEGRVSPVKNPHLLAYQVMDPGMSRLRAALEITERDAQARKNAARHFERAVAQLFSLFGLHADALGGYPGVDDAVDVLVRSPNGDEILAIECTLGALRADSGKTARLAARADELRKEPGLRGVSVRPAMVSSRPRDAIPRAELESAAHDEIAVLCREDLQELIVMAERGATEADAIRYCGARIPISASRRDGVQRFLTGG